MEIDLKWFSTLVPINSLKASYREELARFTTVKAHHRGDTLFRQGRADTAVYYLQQGEIQLTTWNEPPLRIKSGTDEALHPLANRQPRPGTATVSSNKAVVLKVSRRLLDKMMAWAQMANRSEDTGSAASTTSSGLGEQEWMAAMLRTQAFLQLPSANISKLFSVMEEVSFKAGDVVIRQGEPGDYYYMIKRGKCRVSRREGGRQVVLAELSTCDSFGEDALVSGAPRNAEVSMLADGELMRLCKERFSELLKAPLVRSVSPDEASALMKQSGVRIDVRLESEYQYDGLKNSLNIPLYLLRLKAPRLDPKNKYLLYCDTGERSAAAAFLMSSMGFDTYVLQREDSGMVVEEDEADV